MRPRVVTARRRRPVKRLRTCFVVESGTDVRLVEGLAERFELEVVGRSIEDGSVISHPPKASFSMTTFPPSRIGFGAAVFRHLIGAQRRNDLVLVQGYG